MYINKKTLEVRGILKLKNISLPKGNIDDLLESLGYSKLSLEGKPSHKKGRLITPGAIVENNGSFTQTWEVDDTNVDLLRDLRQARDAQLAASDWTQASDSTKPVEGAVAWATYRQELRDLPANTSDFENVVWPEAPIHATA